MQIEYTKSEKEILNLLIEHLTVKQIAIRRGNSQQNIYRIIKNLRKKGAVSKPFFSVEKDQCTIQQKNFLKGIRLHGQEINVKILYQSKEYKKNLSACNYFMIDTNTIRLYRNSIEIYIGHSFFKKTVNEAHIESLKYLKTIIMRLEHRLKVILTKPQAMNMKIVKEHYAEINNGIARQAERTGQNIAIKATEDGQNWFICDNSYNLYEGETTHTGTAKQDMGEVLAPYLNDLRDKQPLTNSKLTEQLYLLGHITKDTATEIKIIAVAVNKLLRGLNVSENKKVPEKGIKTPGTPEYIG